LLQALHPIESARLFLKGATLFEQGSAATGIYLVKSGEVRVLLLTGQNQAQLLEVAGPGTMLGLSESMSGERYRITAEAGDRTLVSYIPREEFVAFLRLHVDFCGQVLRHLRKTCTDFTTSSAASALIRGGRDTGRWTSN
jgi:CRP-like cAMP-binding protein